MFNTLLKISLLLWILSLLSVSYANPTDPVVKINDTTITQQAYDDYAKARMEQTRTNVMPDTQTLIDELVDRELLRQAALQQKLEQSPEFQEKIKQMQDNLLMAMVMQNYLDKHPLDDAKLKQEYDAQVAKIKMPSEYKARHILVEKEETAKAIIAELQAGKTLAELAKQKSIDPDSANKEGDLGWVTSKTVEPEFGKALEQLKKGQYTTTPVKTKFGWHIIQVDDLREVPLPPFENVKEKIKTSLQGQQMQKYMDELKKQAKIEVINPVKAENTDKDKATTTEKTTAPE
ncbi:MAG: peptidylprolyl isomerase [Thioploca sp.]|nr:peptidylprolyl isomerase [Thioploca sp.]